MRILLVVDDNLDVSAIANTRMNTGETRSSVQNASILGCCFASAQSPQSTQNKRDPRQPVRKNRQNRGISKKAKIWALIPKGLAKAI
ncbi:MAG TPA: hypothetical protein VGG85_10735 [Terracidiphilus sp.]